MHLKPDPEKLTKNQENTQFFQKSGSFFVSIFSLGFPVPELLVQPKCFWKEPLRWHLGNTQPRSAQNPYQLDKSIVLQKPGKCRFFSMEYRHPPVIYHEKSGFFIFCLLMRLYCRKVWERVRLWNPEKQFTDQTF